MTNGKKNHELDERTRFAQQALSTTWGLSERGTLEVTSQSGGPSPESEGTGAGSTEPALEGSSALEPQPGGSGESPQRLSPSTLLDLLRRYRSGQFPDQRFGQLVINHFRLEPNAELFYCEDDALAFDLAFTLLKEGHDG